jgi:hypothetical protein
MAKSKLNIDFDYDFLIWGLTSNFPDYKLCWKLNQIFEWKLIRNDDIKYFPIVGEEPIFFSHFEYPIPEDHYSIELVKQKNDGFVLLNELKNFDYLLIVRGARDFFNQEELTIYLNKIQGIQIAISIDIEKIKTKQHLIFN